MIGSTLYFGNPTKLSIKNKQLYIEQKEKDSIRKIPVEDIACIMIDHPQVHINAYTIRFLAQHKVVILFCDESHLPISLLLPLQSHHLPNARERKQLEQNKKLKSKLWKTTVQEKISNQSRLLEQLRKNANPLKRWLKEVKAQDNTNIEAKAAKYYWNNLFDEIPDFRRERFGEAPNNLLNFGYSLIRSMFCRAIVSVGLLPVVGIHHHNQYNPFCLADDIMEPYRPYVDRMVYEIIQEYGDVPMILEKSHKARLLSLNYIDVSIAKKTMPMMNAINKTCYSLVEIFEEKRSKICYPQLTTHA